MMHFCSLSKCIDTGNISIGVILITYMPIYTRIKHDDKLIGELACRFISNTFLRSHIKGTEMFTLGLF